MAEDYLPAERETSMNKSDKIIITLIVFLGLIAIFGIVWHYNESIEVTVKTALATNTIMPGDTRTVTVTQFQPVSNEVTRFMTKTAMVTETREVPVTITVPFTVWLKDHPALQSRSDRHQPPLSSLPRRSQLL
jgi:flagellar basal body-associated protein FliL